MCVCKTHRPKITLVCVCVCGGEGGEVKFDSEADTHTSNRLGWLTPHTSNRLREGGPKITQVVSVAKKNYTGGR